MSLKEDTAIVKVKGLNRNNYQYLPICRLKRNKHNTCTSRMWPCKVKMHLCPKF